MEDLRKGKAFGSMKDAKEYITFYCVRNKHKFIVKRASAKKYAVGCKSRECSFCISCFQNRHEIVRVTTFVLDHSCDHRADDNVPSRTAYIARKVSAVIADNPSMTVAEVVTLMKEEDGIDIPYWAAWKGRKLALMDVFGSTQPPGTVTDSQLAGRPKRLRSRNIRGPGRKCSKCGIIAHHNARTCERRRQAALAPKPAQPEEPVEDVLDDHSLFLNC